MHRFRTAPGQLARSLGVRISLVGALWWAVQEGEFVEPILSAAAVSAVVLISYPLLPAGLHRPRMIGVLRFLPFFVSESVRGGIDVAARAFHPRLPVAPGFIEHPLRLPEGPARVFFTAAVSLLPGTLSTRIRRGSLRVHLLHRGRPARDRIARLEDRVAAMFVDSPGSGGPRAAATGTGRTGPGG